jgi:hypothetical protein
MNIYYWQKKMNLTREEREKKQDGVDYSENRKYSLKKEKEYSHNIIMSTMKLIDYNHCRHLIRY